MKTEAQVQQEIRLVAPTHGAVLWRNNVGACRAADGRHVRYGLANDSAQLNAAVKSADLIGIQMVTITPDMVGQTVGVFLSIECKRGDWASRGTDRERAQEQWARVVTDAGGIAIMAADVTHVWGGPTPCLG